MFIDGVLIETKDLINGISIVQAERVDAVEYLHIELDTHDIIIAEGALSESFIDDDSRQMFHNAHEYVALYPDVTRIVARFCAPRRREGYEVEAVRRRIAERAGLLPAIDDRKVDLRGFIDAITSRAISGWAQNIDYPEAPVCLDILAGSQLIGRVLANRYRAGRAWQRPPRFRVRAARRIELPRGNDRGSALARWRVTQSAHQADLRGSDPAFRRRQMMSTRI